MSLPMTYSRRKRLREQHGQTRELRTFPIGSKLLQQLFALFQQIDQELSSYDEPLFRPLVGYLRQEKGVPALNRADSITAEFYVWWSSEQRFQEDSDYRLDVIELACTLPFEWIRERLSTEPYHQYGTADRIRTAIREINARMEEDCFAYRFEGKQLIELTSQFLHESAVAPLLGLTAKPAFAAVDQEFRDALAEFRAGNYDDCIADCGNAFESALKVIADQKRWTIKPSDRASSLIATAFEQGLIPPYLQSQFTGLRSVLTGIATVRNNEGAHGSGLEPREVKRHFAEYQLHQTAAAILFLISCAADA